jgi:flavin reductase (DIM6/NTAB) family NADH-FMN oxidoreductase RutF
MRYESFDPGPMAPIDVYKLLIGLIVPRPIGWIGTRDREGVRNLAPYSFFNVVSGQPPTVLFSAGRRRGDAKDSAANALATGEFTVNIVTEEVAAAMNLTSGDYPPDVDEFALAGLTSRPGDVVAAPMVNEVKAALECRVTRRVDIGDPVTNTVIFGEVVLVHISGEVLDGTRVRPDVLRAVGRMAGNGYVTTADSGFEMERPA